jgi:hypothetical protein
MKGILRKSIQIFIEDSDTWENKPLYEAIVRMFQKRGIAGATVWNGVMGYGAARRIHRRGLFGVSDEKPVVITAVDSEESLRAILPDLLPMIKEGIVVLQDAEVFVKAGERSENKPA